MRSPDPFPGEPRALRVSHVRFIREQDGGPERVLKGRLEELFKQGNVRRAYLAQVSVDAQPGVALCLSCNSPEPDLVREIGSIFAAIFSHRVHLDILFLDDSQEATLSRVCAPFYSSSA